MLGSILLMACVPGAALAAGSLAAALWRPQASTRSTIQHFAAGIVFAVVAVELLPDLRATHQPWLVAVGFALGGAFMLIVDRATEAHAGGRDAVPSGMFVAIGIDLLLDGVLIGIAFAAGEHAGILVAVALSCEMVPLGMTLTIGSTAAGTRGARVVLAPAALALTTLVGGAAAGATILAHASRSVMGGVLAFGSAALLFLVTEELLVEAHAVEDTPWAATMFFAGFLVLLVLGMR